MDLNDPLKPVQMPVDPPWILDGSFVVFRRLYQDVVAFSRFIEDGVRKLTSEGFQGITAERLGAMCTGRWTSGTPILRAPLVDDPRFAVDSNDAVNSFFYDTDTAPVIWSPSSGRQTDTLPPAHRDFDGVTCPLAAHIRKINPRDETTDQGDSTRTLKHRIIRRGIPYGDAYDPAKPGSDRQDRGLLFIAYQSSIEGQFEFLQRTWANVFDAPRTAAGVDPIIGQTGNDDPAQRMIWFVKDDDTRTALSIPERVVFATGGAYLFVPSISAIQNVLTRVS
jgi:Dyp-type peroxidase family